MPREALSVRLDPDVLEALDRAVEATGSTRTDVVTRILRRGLRLPDSTSLDAYLDTLTARSDT